MEPGIYYDERGFLRRIVIPRNDVPRCRCWNPTAREHQYDCPVAESKRRHDRRARALIAALVL